MYNGSEDDLNAIRRLWAAKLLLHAKDYAMGIKATNGKRPKTGRDVGNAVLEARRAYHWIESKENKPASFVWICEIFDFDPDRTRMLIFHRWRDILQMHKKNPLSFLKED
jgi:hypothetical protein